MYVVRGSASPDAITRSLQALLPTRHQPIAQRKFAVLDTFDGRVRRAGARLAHSGESGAPVVTWQPRGGRGELTVRLSQPVSFAWDLPDGPLRQALAPVIGVRRLFAQADAEERGARLDVLDDRGKTVARLSIESGQARSLMAPSVWHSLPTIVTLTALRGYEDVYARLVPVIESRPGVTSCPEGFQGVILREVGAPEPGDLSSPRVDLAPTVRADAGARQIHRALLDLLAANEPGLRANLDTEFLHDFRVAVRRTRSLLGQIKHVFPGDAVEHFSTEFSWLGRLTGPPRDIDVLVLALRGRHAGVPAGDLEPLMTLLGRTQHLEHQAIVDALDSERYRRLLSEWKAFLDQPVPSEPEAPHGARPLADLVAHRAWRLSRRIAASAEAVDERTPAALLHEVRIAAKKLRYLVDVAPAFYDASDLARILTSLKKLQRVLGDFNDAEVQEARLLECGRALGAAGGHAGVLVALGRLAEQSRQRREGMREEVADRLARFASRATRSACRRAFKRHTWAECAR